MDEHSIGGMILEIVWSVIPLGLSMVMFAWGASIFFTESRPPADSMEIYVTGKQWMWKIQHMEGAREINELHIPVNRDIRLTLTSEDVIHDFYVPAFRTKTDVLPGKYTTEWFRPTKVGAVSHLLRRVLRHQAFRHDRHRLRDERGGLQHVARARAAAKAPWRSRARRCSTSWAAATAMPALINKQNGRCPNLNGLFGTTVDLKDGSQRAGG